MRKIFYFAALTMCGLFLSSCAVTGALIGGSGLGFTVYKEMEHHHPELLPKIAHFPTDNELKSAKNVDRSFGFDCTKLNTNKNQSECFNQFAKSVIKKENNIKSTQNKATRKIIKSLSSQDQLAPKKPKNTNKRLPAKPLTSISDIGKPILLGKLEANSGVKIFSNIKDNEITQGFPKKSIVLSVKNEPQNLMLKNSDSNESKELIYSNLSTWINAWENQDINTYLSFYSKDFKYPKKSRSEWEADRHRALKVNSSISIEVSNIQAYQRNKIVETNFIQKYKSDSFSDIGIKELVWKEYDGSWKIIKETWIPKDSTSNYKKLNNSMNIISSELLNWAKAWGSQNIHLYMSFYSKDFKYPKNSRSKWEADRHRALKTNSNITIELSNIQISQNKSTVEINFIQHFKSDTFSDIGIKELIWSKKGNNWKILKETWIPS